MSFCKADIAAGVAENMVIIVYKKQKLCALKTQKTVKTTVQKKYYITCIM